jgi:putative oxidoreductase
MSNYLRSNNIGILIIRLVVGLLLLPHGISKLINGVDWLGGLLTKVSLPPLIRYGVFIGEIIAPILLIIGYRTRIAALFVAFNMLMTVFLAHRNLVFVIRSSGSWAIELNALFFFGALALFFTGGGKYCVSTKNKWD